MLEIAAWLRDCRRIVVLTHVKPDGDAVGSSIAVTRALNLLDAGRQPRAEAWYFGPLPPWFDDVVGNTPHRLIDPRSPGKEPPDHADPEAIVIVDTGSWMQLDPIADWLRKRTEVAVVIDHHVQGDPEIAELRVVDISAAAACQPAAELCRRLLDLPAPSKLPVEVATPLYLGLATDTGWFRHSNVDRAVMTLSGDLIAAGARHVWLYQTVEQQDTPGRLRLLARALASLELVEIGKNTDGSPAHLAIMSLRKQDFAESAAAPGESGGFVDYTQGIASVRVTALLTEVSAAEFGINGAANGTDLTKISLRSKNPTKPGQIDVDVNAAAKGLQGGGHVRAAGGRMPVNLEATKKLVIDAVRGQAKPSPA